ncbi:hypothetical protein GQ602_000434 [Ophiocordyceps camponoti-floridani]|uniref:Uncharacterized protein n=1 Tax=Ophiocordyceps camponoti-floridani TaxID=2030778 RepID=A0A8H4QC39_9HYPO|nr:hypothetical protein GQ602_000434 [Ophiocordyceps camponoti-floridani]
MTPWNGAVSRPRPRSETKPIRGIISGPMPLSSLSGPVDDNMSDDAYVVPWRASRHLDVERARKTTTTTTTTTTTATAAGHGRSTIIKSALGKLLSRRKKPADRPTPIDTSVHHHPSDPLSETRPSNIFASKRAASLPVTEYDRALRSNSISPEDVLAIRSAGSSLYADPATRTEASDATSTLARLPGSPPRPASSHGRRLRVADWTEDPDDIGRAITSDMRRRSRSVSAFPISVSAFVAPVRRRSRDVFFWPTPPSSAVQDTTTTLTAGEQEADAGVVYRPRSRDEAANAHLAKLNSRVTDLEARNAKLEQVVTRLTDSLARLTSPSARDGQPETPIVALTHGPKLAADSEKTALQTSSHGSRPLSLATVRNDSGKTMTADQYLSLVSLLETERSARETLEGQVRSLSHQVYMTTSKVARRPSAVVSHGGVSAFDLDDEDDEDEDGVVEPIRSFSRCAASSEDRGWNDYDDEDDEDDEDEEDEEDEAREREAYRGSLDLEASTEDDVVEETVLKATARAMSLSRLTLSMTPFPVQRLPSGAVA